MKIHLDPFHSLLINGDDDDDGRSTLISCVVCSVGRPATESEGSDDLEKLRRTEETTEQR